MQGANLSIIWPIEITPWMDSDYKPHCVSVIMGTYNCELYIAEAIQSVIHQTYRPIELIVVDDGSTDSTPDILKRFSAETEHMPEFQFRSIRQENQGHCGALNTGLVASKGEFIQYFDSDDLLHPEKISTHVQALRGNPGLDFVYGSTCVFKDSPPIDGVPEYGNKPDLGLVDHMKDCQWTIMDPLYRRRACIAAGPWYTGIKRLYDWEYTVRVLLTNPSFKSEPDGRSFYRRGHVYHQQRAPGYSIPWLKDFIRVYTFSWDNMKRVGCLHQIVLNNFARHVIRVALNFAALGAGTEAIDTVKFALQLKPSMKIRLAGIALYILLITLGARSTAALTCRMLVVKNSLA